MVEWLQLRDEQKKDTLNQVGAITGLPVNTIEKDWWVTLTLKACFQSPYAKNLVFKGGTSLSKAWQLIERFSEDIDLVLDREILGYSGELSKTKIKKLREATANFVAGEFRNVLQQTLVDMGVDPALFDLYVEESGDPDRDPQILILKYKAVTDQTNDYLPDRVKLEIGCRSLMEPASTREVHSIVGLTIPDQQFSGKPFNILTVDPQRTMLEKMFLLHEEFSKEPEKVRHDRMSRHLYDLHRLMDTEHGTRATTNPAMYQFIVRHREKYTPVRGLNYSRHLPQTISFIPPDTVAGAWEKDYRQMQEMMIYGESPAYTALIGRMEELITRVRKLNIE